MSHLANAADAWGDALPDWVKALAAKVDETSLSRCRVLVGYSAATISYVIRRRYPGDMAAVEERVRATLMASTVICPEVGEMSLASCIEWRGRCADFKPLSGHHRKMRDACALCPRNAGNGS